MGIDVVGEAENRFAVAFIPLQGDLHADAFTFALDEDDVWMDRVLRFPQMLDERRDPSGIMEEMFLVRALVFDMNFQPAVEKGELAKTL